MQPTMQSSSSGSRSKSPSPSPSQTPSQTPQPKQANRHLPEHVATAADNSKSKAKTSPIGSSSDGRKYIYPLSEHEIALLSGGARNWSQWMMTASLRSHLQSIPPDPDREAVIKHIIRDLAIANKLKVEYKKMMRGVNDLTFRPLEDLRKEMDRLGIDVGQEVEGFPLLRRANAISRRALLKEERMLHEHKPHITFDAILEPHKDGEGEVLLGSQHAFQEGKPSSRRLTMMSGCEKLSREMSSRVSIASITGVVDRTTKRLSQTAKYTVSRPLSSRARWKYVEPVQTPKDEKSG